MIYILKILANTFIKPGIAQASTYSAKDILFYRQGDEIKLTEYKVVEDGHLEITLIPNHGRKNYVFQPHVELYTEKGDLVKIENEDDDTAPQVNALSIPDTNVLKEENKGRKITVPGISKPVYLNQPIILEGSFTWAEATHDGERIPKTQNHTLAIVKVAKELEIIRKDVIKKPFHVTSWYRPEPWNRRVGGVSNSQHIYGGAVDFWVDGYTGKELYKILDPIWKGGLGMYKSLPNIVHVDVRSYKARWTGSSNVK